MFAQLSIGTTDPRFSDDTCSGIGFNDPPAILSLAIGQSVDLLARLDITAVAGNCCELGKAEVDALMRFYVDPVGSSFSYTSLTGQRYETPLSAPLPEPTTWLLIGTGLTGIILKQVRQRGARRARREQSEKDIEPAC